MPTFVWPCQRGRSARAIATAPASALMIRKRRRLQIGEGQPERVPPRLANEPVMQRAEILLAVGPRFLVELGESPGACRISDASGGSGGPNEIVIGYGSRAGQPPGVGRAEDAAVQAVEMHRDDRSGAALDDALEPALKRRHQARCA